MCKTTVVTLIFVIAALTACCHKAELRNLESAGAAPTTERALTVEPAPAPAPMPEAVAPAEPATVKTDVTAMSPTEIRSLVDVTIDRNEGLQKVITNMSGKAAPVISIDREPDAIYPYYDVYVGAQSGDHGWRLFTFIIDPRTKTLKVECKDVAGFSNGTVDEFVSAWNACEDIQIEK